VKPSAALDKIEEEEDDDNSNTPLSGAGNKKGSGLNLKQQMSHSSIGNYQSGIGERLKDHILTAIENLIADIESVPESIAS
jgi:hypothetical protein